MNVKRQYSLPNCILILEGLSDDFAAPNPGDSRPLLSILTNAECRLAGVNEVLQGGRVFFENLVKAVSSYAQEYLSGVKHPIDTSPTPDRVYLERNDRDHRLVWYPPADLPSAGNPVYIDLTTVQLFDLVEAIDQFCADSRTLPDLTLKLQPVSRRYRQGDERTSTRVIPFLTGVGSLALCALIFSLLPIPEIRKPENKPVALPSPAPTLPVPVTR